MKNVTVLFLFLIMLSCFWACKKDQSVDINNTGTSLDASKTSAIKKGEPVVFTFPGASANDTIHWSVTPSANVQINISGNKASVLFGLAGKYAVAAHSGGITASMDVSVNDTAYTGGQGVTYSTVALTGDEIMLTPSRIDSGSYSGLIIYASTKNNYNCLNNFLSSSLSANGADYTIDYAGVSIPDAANCTSGQIKSVGTSFIYPIEDGTHAFKVKLNGTVYTGSFTKNGKNYTFNWGYASGITIAPTTIN